MWDVPDRQPLGNAEVVFFFTHLSENKLICSIAAVVFVSTPKADVF